jgi:3-oxoacyl-[acyl-carrier protein] reductase
MSDKYLELANSTLGKAVFAAVGLPDPVPLQREDPNQPHQLRGQVLLGASDGAIFAETIGSFITIAGAEVCRDAMQDTGQLLFDASGIANAQQSDQLYRFFNQHIRSIAHSGRVIVVGCKPSALDDAEYAAVQRGLLGFVKSLAKEIGRKGATANLVLVDKGGDQALEGPIRFLLSAGSAFMNAQVLTVATPVASMEADWTAPLTGKTVLVTGAARGIGLAISQTLARDGAKVIGVDVPQSQNELDAQMVAIGGLSLPLDITDTDAPQRLRDFCLAHSPILHAIVHNAGVTRDKMLSKMTSHQWDLLVQINLGALQRINQALLDTKLLDNGGRIVGVASISGIAGNVGQTNYAFSKAAVIGVVESLADSCAARGITINGVAPGFIETQMTAAIPFVTRQMGRRLSSLGQGGLPVDVAEVIGFYLSPQAAGINGNMVRVCGQSLLGA